MAATESERMDLFSVLCACSVVQMQKAAGSMQFYVALLTNTPVDNDTRCQEQMAWTSDLFPTKEKRSVLLLQYVLYLSPHVPVRYVQYVRNCTIKQVDHTRRWSTNF